MSPAGYADVHFTEFDRTGQEGSSEWYDAWFSIVWNQVGEENRQYRPNNFTHNSFHNGFNTAFGGFRTDALNIEDCVIHNTVGAGRSYRCNPLFSLFRTYLMF